MIENLLVRDNYYYSIIVQKYIRILQPQMHGTVWLILIESNILYNLDVLRRKATLTASGVLVLGNRDDIKYMNCKFISVFNCV